MTKTIPAVRAFIGAFDSALLVGEDLSHSVNTVCFSPCFKDLLLALIENDAFSPEMGHQFSAAGAIEGLSACRRLRSGLNSSLSSFFTLLSELLSAFDASVGTAWSKFAAKVQQSSLAKKRLLSVLLSGPDEAFYAALVDQLIVGDPHAVHPPSSYRQSAGFVVSTEDDQSVEAVMTHSTFTSIRVVEDSLEPHQTLLKDMYSASGHCVCLIDQNVERFYGEKLEHYYDFHGIPLDKLV